MNNKKLTSNYVRSFYNNFVRNLNQDYSYWRWFQNKISQYHYQQTNKTIAKLLGNKRFNNGLEIGSGDGTWTKILSTKCHQLTALDLSPLMIKKAQQKLIGYNNINFVTADFLKNRLPANHYDLVAAIRAIEYFEDKSKTIKEAERLLKKGGCLLIITKNPSYTWRHHQPQEIIHSGQIDISALKKMLTNQGFSDLIIYPAIIGKGLSVPPLRRIFAFIHACLLQDNFKIIPFPVYQYFTESFAILAQKK